MWVPNAAGRVTGLCGLKSPNFNRALPTAPLYTQTIKMVSRTSFARRGEGIFSPMLLREGNSNKILHTFRPLAFPGCL